MQTQAASCGSFWAAVFTHINALRIMHRNRKGKDRRHYSDFDVQEGLELPCGCKPLIGQSRRFRLFEDGDLIHHGCYKVFISPDKKQMLQMDIWTQAIELRVVPRPNKPKDDRKTPYGSHSFFVR
ncbi:MAG: hypothetical protein ACYC5G_02255 [Candidatus Doudnabacteria bacterium]